MLKTIRCTVNGKARELSFDVRASLLEVLRAEGLTSSKQGCGVGECGACTVLVDNIPVDSCIFLAVWADGKTIRTAEGEAKGNRLSRVQQAYVDAGAVQCGFCTPGLVMSSTAFIEKHKGQPVTREEIRRGHAGNLCRCTGYDAIIAAVEKLPQRHTAAKYLCLSPQAGRAMPPSSKLSKISRVFQQTCPVHDSHVQGLSVLGGIIRNHSTTGERPWPRQKAYWNGFSS